MRGRRRKERSRERENKGMREGGKADPPFRRCGFGLRILLVCGGQLPDQIRQSVPGGGRRWW
jgi:hypothetical protein